MILRQIYETVRERLDLFPAVALLGPRQVGKTTLAEIIAEEHSSVYLDLEKLEDLEKLSDPGYFLNAHEHKLIILDEIQHTPNLFPILRGIIDKGRKQGLRTGRFLLLGSASGDLLRQSRETLAGRIAYVEMSPLHLLEVGGQSVETLWIRGGFPDSFLAKSNRKSTIWRDSFILTYLERDLPRIGSRVPVATLRRLWTMLSHLQGETLNTARIARGLGLDVRTVNQYLDFLVDLLLIRLVPPYYANVGKRLVKSPKVYVRDSGILHSLLGLDTLDAVLGHPVVGGSWEGFVIETLVSAAPERAGIWFYRTAAGAEIDLVMEMPGGELWAIEIKRSSAPKMEKGFHHALQDLRPAHAFLVGSNTDRYPKTNEVEVISLADLARILHEAA
ncbi:MAG: ATP-binding protein [Gammaproteobacteria bacterium]|nr:ATP-binding protein [Gammaproteobacteria bacterium]